jgi:hypothetical protein
MRRRLAVVFGIMTTLAGVLAPTATAVVDAPIGRVGDTLRLQYGGAVVDVTLNGVSPTVLQDGMDPARFLGGTVWRADMTVHPITVPTPYFIATAFTYSGVALSSGDAYPSQHSDAPDALETALTNAPQGSTVSGAAFFDVYRSPLSNIVVRSVKTGIHLAQWNLS